MYLLSMFIAVKIYFYLPILWLLDSGQISLSSNHVCDNETKFDDLKIIFVIYYKFRFFIYMLD